MRTFKYELCSYVDSTHTLCILSAPSQVHYKTIRDPAVQKGKPLPEKGVCKHYKQSHRWLRYHSHRGLSHFTHLTRKCRRRTHSESLTPPSAIRFPCCGRAYPCDVCHDENQDHPMELATRMICGYCAKEQVSCSPEPRADFTIRLFMTTVLSL